MTSHGNDPKPSVFGYLKDKIQTLISTRQSPPNLQRTKLPPFNSQKKSTIQNNQKNLASLLACPKLSTFYTKILYQQTLQALDFLINQSILVGTIGPTLNLDFLGKKYQIKLHEQFNMNNLQNLRQNAFDFIIFNWKEKRYYKDFLRTSQVLVTVLKTDDELKQFIIDWESTISQQMRRTDCFFKQIANKLIFQIFLKNNQYYIILNNSKNIQLYEQLQCILQKNSLIEFRQIIQNTITLRQYFQLRQIFYHDKGSFSSQSLIQYLKHRNPYFQAQLSSFGKKQQEIIPFEVTEIQSISQQIISNQRDCTISNLSRFIQDQEDLGNVMIIKKGTQQLNVLNCLYNMDRYEGVENEQSRSLQQPQRVRKYRTKSCSLYGQECQDYSTDSIEQDFGYD